jgi:hypothetical protein
MDELEKTDYFEYYQIHMLFYQSNNLNYFFKTL